MSKGYDPCYDDRVYKVDQLSDDPIVVLVTVRFDVPLIDGTFTTIWQQFTWCEKTEEIGFVRTFTSSNTKKNTS